MAGTNRTTLCPFCPERGYGPDPTGNLHIRMEDGIYVCHRCGARPTVTGRLPKDEWVTGVFPHPLLTTKTQDVLVADRHDPSCCAECRMSLEPRKIDFEVAPVWLYGGYFYGHRLFFEDGATQWWQGRAVSPRVGMKYLSKPGYTGTLAPMLDMVALGRPTAPVIVEGPTDGLRLWAAGFRAIVLFGKSYSPKKLERLQRILAGQSQAILCLDRDGCEIETAQWVYNLTRFVGIRVWPIGAADPGVMGDRELERLRSVVGLGPNPQNEPKVVPYGG